jgi:hypothetical protein
VLRHDGRSKHRGPLVAARGLWSRVVRPGLLSSMAYVTWARAASRRLRQAARPRTASPRTAPRGLEMHGLELPGSGCASDGLSGWVERLGLCGRGLCGHALNGLDLPGPQVATRRLCGGLGLCGSGAKSRALCGLESSFLAPCGLGSCRAPTGSATSGCASTPQRRACDIERSGAVSGLGSPVARSADVSPEGCPMSGCAV